MAIPTRRVHRDPDARAARRAAREAQSGPLPTPTEAPEPTGKVAKALAGRRAITAFKIEPVKSVLHRFINMLVYGPYGHGKTTYGASAVHVPEMCDVLLINAESGDMSLTAHRTLDVINVKNWKQVARIVEYLFLHVRLRDEATPEAYAELLEMEMELKSYIVPLDDQTLDANGEKDPERTWFVEQRLRTGKPMDEPYLYRTVTIDSISEIYRLLIYSYTGVDIEKTKLDEELEKMEEWPSAQDRFRLFVRQFRSLEANVIFVAAEQVEPAEKNKKRNPRAGQALPKLAGQMASEVAGFIDIVGYLVREEEEDANGKKVFKRYMYLGAGYELWISKHRFENLPDLEYLPDPSLTTLLELARKDAEADGTSFPRPEEADRKSVTPNRNSASPAAANSRRTARHAARSSRRG